MIEEFTRLLGLVDEEVLQFNHIRSMQLIAEGTMSPRLSIVFNNKSAFLSGNMAECIEFLNRIYTKYENYIQRKDKIKKILGK